MAVATYNHNISPTHFKVKYNVQSRGIMDYSVFVDTAIRDFNCVVVGSTMFKIELIDIGNDGCVAEIKTSVDTLAEAEVIAKGEIGGHLGNYDIDLIYDDDLVYNVYSDGRSVGVVSITVL